MAKQVTIRDIARKANVSVSTVSRVLNDSSYVDEGKREAVINAAAALQYQPNAAARSLVRGQTETIGVIANDMGSRFCGAIAQGIAMELQETNYSPIVSDALWSEKTERKAIRNLVARGVDGIIVIGGELPLDRLNELCATKPTLVVARAIKSWNKSNIYVDNFAGAYSATSLLIESGHRDIAFISGVVGRQDATHRFEGFQQALSDRKIEFREELFIESDFVAESACRATETLIERGVDFTAIFCCNDHTAFGACQTLTKRGIRVPEDVSLVGFDDHPMAAYMSPPLTTVNQPDRKLGRLAAQSIIKLIKGVETDSKVIIPEVIVRDSVCSLLDE